MEHLFALADFHARFQLLLGDLGIRRRDLLLIDEHAALLDETARLGLRGRELAGLRAGDLPAQAGA